MRLGKKLLSLALAAIMILPAATAAGAAVVKSDKTDCIISQSTGAFDAAAVQQGEEKSVTVTWQSVPQAKGYNVYRTPYYAYDDINYDNLELLADVSADTLSFTDNNLCRFDSYNYLVCALTDSDSRIFSNPAFAYVKESNPIFSDINDLDEAIQKIYRANELEIVALAKQMRGSGELQGEDKYISMYSNCGPTSMALQRVLFDNGIVTELRRNPYSHGGGYFGHQFILARVNFNGDTSSVANIVFDPTYRQFIRNDMRNHLISTGIENPTENDIDTAFASSAFPTVFVFNYGDTDQALSMLKSFRINSGYEDEFFCEISYNFVTLGGFSYPLQEFMDSKTSIITNLEYDLSRNSGRLDNPFGNDIFISTSADAKKFKMEYKDNGVFQCIIPSDSLTDGDELFITDNSGNTLYGAASEYDSLSVSTSFNYQSYMYKPVLFLKKGSAVPLKFTADGGAGQYCIRIDMRAGLDAPSITMFNAEKLAYGDADCNGEINIKDVSAVQMYIAKLESPTATAACTSNVFEDEQLSVACVSDIQLALAHLDHSGRTGRPMCFLNTLYINYVN